MLQVLWVPYPEDSAPIWARWLNLSGTAIALLIFQGLAAPKIGHRGFVTRMLISFVILAMMKETLRGAVMNAVVTTAWTYSLVVMLVPVVMALAIALLCTVAGRWIRSTTSLVVAGAIVGAAGSLLPPLVGAALSPLMAAAAPLSHPDIYQLPYPLPVLIPAYLTFAEPVASCGLLALLVWPQLPVGRARRIVAFAALVVFLKGVAIRTFLFSFFMNEPPALGMLSQSQFLLEFLALGLLVGAVWDAFGGVGPRRTAPQLI
jgi:hypothetical protein